MADSISLMKRACTPQVHYTMRVKAMLMKLVVKVTPKCILTPLTTPELTDKSIHLYLQPLFLCLPYQAVHAPLEVPEQYKEPFKHIIKDNERLNLAGMISCMDEGIANLTKTLKDTGLYNNSIIIFSTGTFLCILCFVLFLLYLYFQPIDHLRISHDAPRCTGAIEGQYPGSLSQVQKYFATESKIPDI